MAPDNYIMYHKVDVDGVGDVYIIQFKVVFVCLRLCCLYGVLVCEVIVVVVILVLVINVVIVSSHLTPSGVCNSLACLDLVLDTRIRVLQIIYPKS